MDAMEHVMRYILSGKVRLRPADTNQCWFEIGDSWMAHKAADETL